MKQPSNELELKEMHNILRHEPERYLGIANTWIKEDREDIEL